MTRSASREARAARDAGWGTLLRAHGLRRTPARLAILEALEDAPEHPSAEDLFDAVHRAQPGLHRSTVYRTLDTLERAGLLVHAHLGHGSAAYHLAASSHVHAACVTCGAVVEVPSELLDDLGAWLAAEHAFTLDARHFALTGRCAACAGVSPGRR